MKRFCVCIASAESLTVFSRKRTLNVFAILNWYVSFDAEAKQTSFGRLSSVWFNYSCLAARMFAWEALQIGNAVAKKDAQVFFPLKIYFPLKRSMFSKKPFFEVSSFRLLSWFFDKENVHYKFGRNKAIYNSACFSVFYPIVFEQLLLTVFF